MFVCAQVITKQDERGHKLEPYEDAIIEVPEEHMGQVPAAPQHRRPWRLADAARLFPMIACLESGMCPPDTCLQLLVGVVVDQCLDR